MEAIGNIGSRVWDWKWPHPEAQHRKPCRADQRSREHLTPGRGPSPAKAEKEADRRLRSAVGSVWDAIPADPTH